MWTSFLTGEAGTGKTEKARHLAEESNLKLCATTGIASVNLDTVTLHSTLKYFDTRSLEKRFRTGGLASKIEHLAQNYSGLMIDEASMLGRDQFAIIVRAVEEYNQLQKRLKTDKVFQIHLVGDFGQLPPVDEPYAFEDPYWGELFEPCTERLTENYRQCDPIFLEALQLMRRGDAREAAELLKPRLRFARSIADDFEGTTLYAQNDQVNRHNWSKYRKLIGEEFSLPIAVRGCELPEWKYILPEDGSHQLKLKEEALVMILANRYHEVDGSLVYANGDLDMFGNFK